MDKPLTVAREDFINSLVALINSAELPMFVVLDVLKNVQKEVQDTAKLQYEHDKKIYEEEKAKESDSPKE